MKRKMTFTLVVISILVTLNAMLFCQPASTVAAPLTQSSSSPTPVPPTGWAVYSDAHNGFSFMYPPQWFVFPKYVNGRHKGFDPILLSSFQVFPEPYGHELSIPQGGVALLIAFEGNDLAPDQLLEDYVSQNLASMFYEMTGKSTQISGNNFVELSGETGTIWVTSRGSNVYSVFLYSESDPHQNATVTQILSYLQMLQEKPILIPPEARGLSANSGKTPLLHSPNVVAVLPSMRMPWATGTQQFTGGPHVGATDWSCSALRDVATMSGLDFGMVIGTEVLAVAGGTIVYAADAGGAIGKAVGIDHGDGFSTRYWHLTDINSSITYGVLVTQGRLLGTSGYPSAPHLHLELRNWPSNTSYQAHGVNVDGYTARGFIRVSDGQGYNYQGTLTRGAETESQVNYSTCNNVLIKKWTGSGGTVEAKTGGGAAVDSTNIRNTGGGNNPPSAPSNPNPGDNATVGRTNDTTFSWNTNGTSCDIHIWGGPSINTTQTGISCSSFHWGNQWPGAYQWQVTAHNSYGNTAGPTWHLNIRPSAPTGLSASPASQTQINLSWTKSSDDPGSVDSYKIYRNGANVGTTNSGTTSYNDGGLSCISSYSYYVTAVRQGVESDSSNQVNASPQSCGSPPTAPSNPNPGDGATVDRSSDTTFYWSTDGTSCNIHIWGGPGIDTSQTGVSCSSFHWGSQWPGAYQWQVVAINGYGSTVGPTWHLNIKPYAPTSLSASAGSQTQINLSWTKSNDDPGSVDSYKVYYDNGTYIATVNAGTTAYSVNNLTCEKPYSFYVTAVRQGVESNASNMASASTQSCPPACNPSTVPPAVTLLSPPDGGVVGTTTPTLDWADVSSSYCVDYFNILINENGGGQVDVAWPTASQYLVPSGKLVWGKTYTWWVWAHNSLGFGNGSARSFGVGVAPNPPTLSSPSNGTILNRNDSVTLSWSASTGATEYYARIFGGPSIDLNSGWMSNTFWSLGSQWGGNYQWEVKARNSYGESAFTPTWTLTIKYGAPSNLATTVVSQSQINLSWSPSADAPGNIDGYRVYRNGFAINTVGSSTTTYNDTGLNCNTSNNYTVKAYKGSADSDASNTANATTNGCIPDPPTLISPSNNAAINSRTVNFSWQSPNSQNQNGYTFRLSTSSNPDTQPWIVDTGLGNANTTYVYTVSSDAIYYWHMRTWNTSGQASSWVSRTFAVDTAVPTATFVHPVWDAYVNTNQVMVEVSPNDSLTGVTQVQFFAGYYKGSSWGWWDSFVDTNPADGWIWTWNATTVTDQSTAFWVYVWDRAGNLGNNSIGNVRLDRTPPTSFVNPLPAQSSPNFAVAWSGSDNLAGISTYDVQYQDGSGGAWTDWQTNTTNTSATFNGVNGHTYYFRSRARDLAGNIEAWPASADAQTTVVLPDLIVQNVTFSPSNPVVGQPFTTTVQIKNQSTSSITSSFVVDLVLDQWSGCGYSSGWAKTVNSLPAGATQDLTFYGSAGFATSASYHFYGVVDVTCVIAESNESNNIFGPATINIGKASTTTTVTSSANPAVVGQLVTITATVGVVPPGGETPQFGTVTFYDGAATLGTKTLTSGIATFTTSALTAGSHSITAVYSGDSNYIGSTSATYTQKVNNRHWLFLPNITKP